MNQQFFMFKEYLNYRLKAVGRHAVHSPFVYEFIEKVIRDKHVHAEYEQIRELRRALLQNETKLPVIDLGAGSHTNNNAYRSVRSIAAHAGRNPYWGQFLFRLIRFCQPQRILELGTSLGIGTSYMALAAPQAQIISIEGSPAIAEFAAQNFKSLNLSNIEQVVGNFDEVLNNILQKNAPFDFIFIDGNHREEPTLNYFQQSLNAVSNHACLLFDDIHWSSGMARAWNKIKSATEVTLSLDLFFFGLAFLHDDFKEKQHFNLNY